MIKKHFKMLCTMALLSLFLQQSAIASTMYPNAFDNIFEKLDNFFHSDGGHKEINVPEEFLENQYLQDYYEEDEKYLERPEAQQFYKD